MAGDRTGAGSAGAAADAAVENSMAQGGVSAVQGGWLIAAIEGSGLLSNVTHYPIEVSVDIRERR